MFAMFAASDTALGTGGGVVVVGGVSVTYIVKNFKSIVDFCKFTKDAGHYVADDVKDASNLKHQKLAAEAKLEQDQAAAVVHSWLAATEKKPVAAAAEKKPVVAKKKAVKKTAKKVAPAPVHKKAAANPAP